MIYFRASEGFSLGLERTGGFETVAFCEIEPYCRRVLAKHWPHVPCYDDVRTAEFPDADVITAGFPCQDVSLAGKRAGVSGERTGLYREVVRAVRMVRPRYVVMENVAALLGNGMGRVLGDMAENRYDAEWDCISASDVGAPHGRDRVWITLADADKFQRSQRRSAPNGRRKRRTGKTQEAGNANCNRKLQPPRLLGKIRRWVDHAANRGTWWQRDWQAEFEALRGMDDGVPDGLDRSASASGVKALGNTVVTIIPELIGKAIMQAEGMTA